MHSVKTIPAKKDANDIPPDRGVGVGAAVVVPLDGVGVVVDGGKVVVPLLGAGVGVVTAVVVLFGVLVDIVVGTDVVVVLGVVGITVVVVVAFGAGVVVCGGGVGEGAGRFALHSVALREMLCVPSSAEECSTHNAPDTVVSNEQFVLVVAFATISTHFTQES
jgi:hypothetical protein